MARFGCACGDQIRTSGEIPNPDEWLLISDTDFDEWEKPLLPESLHARMIHGWKCRTCGRLLIFWDGMGAEPSWYEPSAP